MRNKAKLVPTDDSSRPYRCNDCGKLFSRPRQLSAHTRIHANQTMYEMYHCEYCERSFVDFAHVFSHEKVFRDVKPHKCMICDKGYKLKRSLKMHMENKHPEEVHMVESATEGHICPDRFDRQVSEALSTESKHVMEHETVHVPLKCLICEIEFRNAGHYKRHMKTHAKERNFECTACPKFFSIREELNKHMQTHVNRDLHCGACNRSFRNQQLFNHHMLSHRRTHLYECPVCEKRYKTLSYLQRHKLKLGHLAKNEKRIIDEPTETERDQSISPELASFTPIHTPGSSPPGSIGGSKEDIQEFIKEIIAKEIAALPEAQINVIEAKEEQETKKVQETKEEFKLKKKEEALEEDQAHKEEKKINDDSGFLELERDEVEPDAQEKIASLKEEHNYKSKEVLNMRPKPNASWEETTVGAERKN